MTATRLPGLDGIRAIAVIAVVWHHAGPAPAGQAFALNGFLGVDLFFVLSGLLITGLLLREQSANGRISLRDFFMRRALRIFPLYFVILALLTLYFLFTSAPSTQRGTFLRELPWLATYTSNWVPVHGLMGISWSLSTEEQFYLAWPPLLAWCGRRALWPLLVFLGANQALNLGLLDGLWPALDAARAHLAILQTTFTPLLLGVLLAFALGSPQRAALRRWVVGPKLSLWLMLVAVLACWPGNVQGLPRLVFHIAATMALAGIVLQPASRIVSALEWKPLVVIGTVSYGVYLWHMMVLDAVVRLANRLHMSTPLVVFAGCLVGTVAVAVLSYRWVEAPLLRLKERYGSVPLSAAQTRGGVNGI